MSINDHYFDNIDLTSHTTLPRASVADIDSLFLARPARAAREKGSNYLDYKTQLLKIQNTQSTIVQYKKVLEAHRPLWPPHSCPVCGCNDFEPPRPPRRSRSSPPP